MRRSQKLNIGIWVMSVIIILLFLATTGILAMRLGGYLPADADVISLIALDPSFEVGDDTKQEWNTYEAIELFKTEYSNEKGEVTVKSANGNAVIAPGTENSYKFYIRNTGKVPLDYEINLTATLKLNGLWESLEHFPICVRVSDQDGNYLLGSQHKWIPVEEAQDTKLVSKGLLSKQSYYAYLIEWKWDYESGNDAFDTAIGSLSAKNYVSVAFDVETKAMQSTGAAGGEQGTADVTTLLITLALILLLLTLLLILLLSRKNRGSRIPLGPFATVMGSLGAAMSLMFLKMFKKDKK